MAESLKGWVASVIRFGATTKEDGAAVYAEAAGYWTSSHKIWTKCIFEVSGLGLAAIFTI